MISTRLLVFIFFLSAIGIAAQSAAPSSTPPKQRDDDSVVVSTDLVQMDVVVTDRSGAQVRDLKPEDFEVYQDGKIQSVSSLVYVNSLSSERIVVKERVAEKGKNRIAPPPAGVRSRQGRIITFVVDDGNCLSSPESIASIRDGLRKFVDKQMLPDDRVAIYRTRTGASLVQTYTSNKQLLKRTLDRINLLPTGACDSSFAAQRDDSMLKVKGGGQGTFSNDKDKEFQKDSATREREDQVIGTLGVMQFVVDRLQNIPARKMLFLLSDGIIADQKSRTFEILRELADKAARASVVINTLSAKGVSIPGMLEARDEVLPGISGGPDNTGPAEEARVSEERELNMGISYLAYATGGRFIKNQNFLEVPIGKILDRETGYYLVGYQPQDETFKGKEFHHIQVKVKRGDLNVSSRKGFYGRNDKQVQTAYKTPEGPIYKALNMPIYEDGIDLRLTTLYEPGGPKGDSIRMLLHVPGNGLTLTSDSADTKKTDLDVVAVIFDENGKLVYEFNRSYPIKVPTRGVSTVMQNGLDFSTDVPVKSAGVYTLRVGFRDANSNRLGSTSEVIEVPKSKGKLFLSSLIATGVDPSGKPMLPLEREVARAFSPVFSMSVPSIRRFKQGSMLSYNYLMNDPKSDGGKTSLAKTVRLYRDGDLAKEIAETPITPSADAGGRYSDSGTIDITDDMAAGEYVLQIAVKDAASGKISSAWIDFEVVE